MLAKKNLKPFITDPDKTNVCPMQVIDLRFQVDPINPMKIEIIKEDRVEPPNARLFAKIIKHWDIKMILDGNEVT